VREFTLIVFFWSTDRARNVFLGDLILEFHANRGGVRTRVEIGHMHIGPAGKGRVASNHAGRIRDPSSSPILQALAEERATIMDRNRHSKASRSDFFRTEIIDAV